MDKKETMTIEEAMEYEGYTEIPLRWTNIPPEETMEERIIGHAVANYNYFIDRYEREKQRTLKELEKACKKGDDVNSMAIIFEKEEDYVKRKGSYGPKFNAWSGKYVYVRGIYDGSTWVVAINRGPTSFELTETIGGG